MDSSIAITTALTVFQTVLPPISEVRKQSVDNPTFAGDVRMGEVAAVLITVGVGGLASFISKDSTPAIVSLVASIGIVALYEWTLRCDRPFEGVV